MSPNPVFLPLTSFPRGTLSSLLIECYRGAPDILERDHVSWAAFDDLVCDNPDTVGRSGFISMIGERLAGFASWDPRGFPGPAVIGHNCVLPEFQGKGLGKRQIDEVLRRLREAGFRSVTVLTGASPLFEPARRMYLAAGFKEVSKDIHPRIPALEVINYEQEW